MVGRLRRGLRGALMLLAIGYPVSLLGVWLLLRFLGEDWWVTGIALYLPSLVYGLPLALLVPALALLRRWRLLALQAVSCLLLLFPLMGLTLNWRSAADSTEQKLRVASYNVNSGHGGLPAIAVELLSHAPDLIFVQELPDWKWAELEALLRPRFAHIEANQQFLVASRFPIVEQLSPERIPFFGDLRSPRFMKVVIETPLGRLTAFHVHTLSPRGGLLAMRGDGLRREVASGRLLSGTNAQSLQTHSALRGLQVAALADMAAREVGPVLIVGDSNLPALSPLRREHWGSFQDGFREAGLGFGGTFPAKGPWMRIDVILATRQLRFTRFVVGDGSASDHRCVVADLVPREP